MERIVSKMLEEYERGTVSRRRLVHSLAALLAAPPAQPAASTFKGVGLNHIAVRVADIPRSREFYQKHLGLPLISQSETSCFLRLGDEFLTFFRNERPGLDHYCIAIENFQPDAVMSTLQRQGLKPRRPAGTDRIYFPDPDGLEVQLSSADHMA
ncbi:MAG: VOC family protein [Bryobacterales bacterium]|nr:VOC family protein [Bryobacterales bacterium]